MISFHLALEVVLASWFPIQVELVGDLGARAGLKFWRGLPQGVSLEPLSIIKSRVSAGPNRSR